MYRTYLPFHLVTTRTRASKASAIENLVEKIDLDPRALFIVVGLFTIVKIMAVDRVNRFRDTLLNTRRSATAEGPRDALCE